MTRAPAELRSVGVVACEMEGEATGVGRYVEGILKALRRTPRASRWQLRLFLQGDPFDHPLWAKKSGGPEFEPVFDRRPKAHPVLWEQFRLPTLLRRRPVDLLFSPGYSLPWGPRVPSVVAIHDLAFEHLPQDFALRERWRRRYLARRAARSATRVLTDTSRTAEELRRRYRAPVERIAVTPLGVSPRFEHARRRVSACNSQSEAELPALVKLGVRPPYVLVLGSVLPRRRLDLVLGAFARLVGEQGPEDEAGAGVTSLGALRLVVAGRNRLRRRGALSRMIRDSGCAERVIRLDYVDEEVLPALYAWAAGTIYVSTYEGYGLPPLESLAAGTPVLVSDAPALTEIWPGYPFRCARLEVEQLTEALRRLLFDRDERRRVISEGHLRVRALSWERAAECFAAEIETAWRVASGAGP